MLSVTFVTLTLLIDRVVIMKEYIGDLIRCPLFYGLKHHEIVKLIETCDYHIEKYKEGDIIRDLSENCDEILIILEGEVKTELQSKEGKVLQLEKFKVYDVLALGAVFSQIRPIPIEVIALCDVSLLCLKKEDVLNMCQINRKFLENLLTVMGNRILFLATRLFSTSIKSLKQRIAGYLLEMKNRWGKNIFKLSHTREELAERFGVARPSVSRIFSELEREKIIEISGKYVKIIDESSLKKLLGE